MQGVSENQWRVLCELAKGHSSKVAARNLGFSLEYVRGVRGKQRGNLIQQLLTAGFHIIPPAPPVPRNTPESRMRSVMGALSGTPVSVNDLSVATGLKRHEVYQAVCLLRFQRKAARAAGGWVSLVSQDARLARADAA